jgi:hypothetical protein
VAVHANAYHGHLITRICPPGARTTAAFVFAWQGERGVRPLRLRLQVRRRRRAAWRVGLLPGSPARLLLLLLLLLPRVGLGRGGGRRWTEHFSAPAAATVPQFQKMSERFPLVSFFGVFDEEDYENSSRLTNLIDIQNIGTDLLTPTAGRCPRDMPLEHAARPPACLCLPACLPALVEPAIHMCGFPVCPPVHHGAAGCSGSVRA